MTRDSRYDCVMNANDANAPARHSITLDAYEITDDPDAADLAVVAPPFLLDLARDANATFTNVVARIDADARHACDVTLDFDATPADVARYVATYDADDAITPA